MNSSPRPGIDVFTLRASCLGTAIRSVLLLLGLGLGACSDTPMAPAAATTLPPTAPPVVPSQPPAPPKAARVEIVQTGLLLTEPGQTRPLQARVLAADGTVLDRPVSWSSSNSNDIGVSNAGVAKAQSRSGSSQIVASVDSIRSRPLLAVVTTVAPGTVLVDDAQIVRGAVETTPDAEPSLDNTYSVVVSGIAAPAVGTLMAGTGSQPVAGRVVSTRAVAGGIEVTLKLAPIPELFPGLEIDEDFDLSQAEITIPENIASRYDVTREGDTFRFRPKIGVVAKAAKVGTAAGTFAFDQGCEGSVNGAGLGPGASPPFVFDTTPNIDFTLSPHLQMRRSAAGNLERLVVLVEPTVTLEAGVTATVAFEGKVECRAELIVYRIPIGGAVSVLVSGLVPVGVGFELAGKVQVAQVKAGFKSVTKAKAFAGLVCNPDCGFAGEITDFSSTTTPTVDLPEISDFRVEPDFTGFIYVEGDIGNPVFNSLRFEAFEFKAGPKLEGKFAAPATQVAAADFKSSYKLVLKAFAGFGDDIEKVLNIFGVVQVGDEVLEIATDLAGSPTGVLTVDRERFVTGDTVKFQLKVDPATASFLGIYNVREIVLMREVGELREVARMPATDGQTTFDFIFIAPNEGQTGEFTAFAVTRLLPVDVLSLELDTARATNQPPVAANDAATVVQGSQGQTILVLANDIDPDGDPLQISTVTQPSQGAVTIGDGGRAVSYRPAQGFSGVTTFRYTVIDGKGGSDEGLVQVEVRSGPVTVRVERAGISSRADATSCPKVRNGVCANAAPLFTEQRFYNESTGIPASDRTSAKASDDFEGKNVRVETQGQLAIGGGGRQIDLQCESVGSGTGNGGDSNVAYGGSAASGSTVELAIEGEGSVRYEISVIATATGPASPSTGQKTARVFGGIRDLYEVREDSIEGKSVVGDASGLLGPGGYLVEVSCIGQVPGEGGTPNSSAILRLTLSP